MARPPDREARSEAEGLFADLLLGEERERERRLEELCARRPELAAELRVLRREWHELRSLEGRGLPAPTSTSAAPSTPPEPRPSVPGYDCRALIGRGGMGEVWEARDLKLGRKVALKLLPAGWLGSEVGRERFRREALAAGRVSHPGVVAVFAAGEDDGRPWIAQELVAGGRTLRDAIEELRRGGVPPGHERAVAELFAQVAEALEAAHREGVVHRDLKPQNLLLDARGAPKVADFGLARLEGEAPLSRTGEFLGTWLYASPEHLETSEAGVDARSDVFCLGVVLYECLTLQRPFAGDTSQEIARAILQVEPPAPHLVRSRVPRDLSVVCMKALEKRRAERYASMQALADDLRRFLGHESVLARPPGPVGRARRWSRRHPARATALALGSAALLVFVALFWRTLTALDQTRAAREREARANAQLATANEDLRLSRDEARGDRAVSDEVVDVLSDLFRAADPALYGREEPSVRQLVERGVARLRAGEPASPRARARLASTLGGVLNTLGDWPGAEELLAEAERTWRELGLVSQPEALATRASRLEVLMNLGRGQEAQPLAEELVEAWRAGGLPQELAAKAFEVLGLIESQDGAYAAAREHLGQSLALRAAAPQADTLQVAYTRSMLARVDWFEGRYADGLSRIEPDLDLLAPLLGKGNPLALDLFNMRGMFLQGLKRPREAEEVFLETLEASEQALGPDHPRSLNLRINLGTVLEDLGRLDEAEALYRETLELALDRYGPTLPESRGLKNNLANCLITQGRYAEAEPLLRELVADTERGRGPDHVESGRARFGLATCLWHLGRAAEAAAEAERAIGAIPPDYPMRARLEAELERFRSDAAAASGL